MYKLCKTEQSAARQRQLEQGLLQAMRTQQYEDISISDLCDRMGVPRKSFYRYFSNKDGALFALLDHTFMEFEQPVDYNHRGQQTLADLERFFVFWYERKDLLAALQRSRLCGLLVERATAHALHERLMPGYLVAKEGTTQRVALTFIICGLLSMVLTWHSDGYQEMPTKMAQTASMLLKKPLLDVC